MKKNILAENMLRFGPKNLTESELDNLKRLTEQDMYGPAKPEGSEKVPMHQMNCNELDAYNYWSTGKLPDGYTGLVKYCNGKTGKVLRVVEMVNGVMHGIDRSWTNDHGGITVDKTWKNGKKDGLYRSWWDNGQISYETNYKADQIDGVEKEWHTTGQLQFERNWKDGKITNDRVAYYDKNGVLDEYKYYKDGEEMKWVGDGFRSPGDGKKWEYNGDGKTGYWEIVE